MRYQINKIFYLFIIIYLSLGCVKIKTLKDYYAGGDIKINELQSKRLNNYLNGEFYSYELGRNVLAFPMYFLISEGGDKSVIIACESIFDECNHSVYAYQYIQKYKKKFNEEFKILAINKNILVENVSLAKKKFKKKEGVIKSDKEIFFDLVLIPHDNCDSDEC